MKKKKSKSKAVKSKTKRSPIQDLILRYEIALNNLVNNITDDESFILQNEIKCLHCGDQIFSAHRHDFKFCKCLKCAVDGGQAYLKRSGIRGTDYEDKSICYTGRTVKKLLKEIHQHMFITPKNQLGILCAIVRTLRDAGVLK